MLEPLDFSDNNITTIVHRAHIQPPGSSDWVSDPFNINNVEYDSLPGQEYNIIGMNVEIVGAAVIENIEVVDHTYSLVPFVQVHFQKSLSRYFSVIYSCNRPDRRNGREISVTEELRNIIIRDKKEEFKNEVKRRKGEKEKRRKGVGSLCK